MFNHHAYTTIFLEDAASGNPAVNDAAEKYGVTIEPADVAPGEKYWRVIGVHHLKPMENWGNHHVFLEVLDVDGNRVRNPAAWAGFTWKGRLPDETAPPIVIDKPNAEPGGNIAIGKNQLISVWMQGRDRNANFNADTAKLAKRVTAIGSAITADTLATVRKSGAQVEHLVGTVAELESLLAERIRTDTAFGG